MNEYWVVKERSSGKIIAHCGDINDAIMMVSFDPNNRSYSRNRVLMDQVIDISSTTDKQLPGQLGLPAGKEKLPISLEQNYLPDNQQVPVNTK
jgi:hypothetical protein